MKKGYVEVDGDVRFPLISPGYSRRFEVWVAKSKGRWVVPKFQPVGDSYRSMAEQLVDNVPGREYWRNVKAKARELAGEGVDCEVFGHTKGSACVTYTFCLTAD